MFIEQCVTENFLISGEEHLFSFSSSKIQTFQYTVQGNENRLWGCPGQHTFVQKFSKVILETYLTSFCLVSKAEEQFCSA